jgi:NADH-quinone oxidoreductase subunit M
MFPYLEVLVFLPAIAGVLLFFFPSEFPARYYKGLGLSLSLAELVVATLILLKFKTGVAGYQMTSSYRWIPSFGISWSLGVDGISLFLVILSVVLFPIAIFGSKETRDPKSFIAWMLVLEAACVGSFLVTDLFDFFLMFELTLIPTYFLMANWGFSLGGRAAVKFFVYTFLGSAFLLVGILALVFIHEASTGQLTFSISALAHTQMSSTAGRLLFLAFSVAFLIKAPVFPFHTWSPDAYSQSPISTAIVLGGVMAKLGTYGILRFDFQLFPQASRSLGWLILTLAVVGIGYGAITAAGESHLSRLVAYSSLSHMGFIVLGLFAFTTIGLSGAVLQMFNHGIYTAALFLLLGMIYSRRNTLDTSKLAGLQSKAPVMAGIFTVVMLASIGVPGLNGFVGEFMILLGAFVSHRWWAVVGVSGVILSAIYMLWAYQKVFHRKDPEQRGFKDLSVAEVATLVPLVILIVGVGLFPSLLLNRINPSVHKVLSEATPAPSYQSSLGKVGR